jgi:ABC-type uncharacterized transport system permease subunit
MMVKNIAIIMIGGASGFIAASLREMITEPSTTSQIILGMALTVFGIAVGNYSRIKDA